jgi:hypothetical protein
MIDILASNDLLQLSVEQNWDALQKGCEVLIDSLDTCWRSLMLFNHHDW